MNAQPTDEPLYLRSQPYLIWLVPMVALVIGITLLIQSHLAAGPLLTVVFTNASGLEAGKTVVKFKEVNVGVVEAVSLSSDDAKVLVQVRLNKNAENLTAADSRFWVVRPRVAINGVSGIDTLFSGAYIGVDKGKAAQHASEFNGLEQPPSVINDTPGSQFLLNTDDLGSLDVGSPVYFRRVQVGRIASYHLQEDGKGVQLRVFIDAPYDRLVTANSRFWNVSGLDLSVGSNGFQLKTQTVAAIMAGGIAFYTPESQPSAPANPAAIFPLAADQDKAMAPADGQAMTFRLRFEHSVRGLEVGAPVVFASVRIGRVSAVSLDYDPHGYRFPTLVDIEVYPARMGNVLNKLPKSSGDPAMAAAVFTEDLVDHGLRAQAVASSLLTGQLTLTLDFFPKAAKVPFDRHARPLMLPTIGGGLDEIQQQLADIVGKINKMPLESIGNRLDSTLFELSKTLRIVNTQTLPGANSLLLSVQKSSDNVQNITAEDSPLLMGLVQTLQESARAFKAIRNVSDQLSRHPESLIQGRAADRQAMPEGKQ